MALLGILWVTGMASKGWTSTGLW